MNQNEYLERTFDGVKICLTKEKALQLFYESLIGAESYYRKELDLTFSILGNFTKLELRALAIAEGLPDTWEARIICALRLGGSIAIYRDEPTGESIGDVDIERLYERILNVHESHLFDLIANGSLSTCASLEAVAQTVMFEDVKFGNFQNKVKRIVKNK